MAENDVDTGGTPRWVKVFGIVALVVIALIVVLVLTGRGGHGPARHTVAADGSGRGDAAVFAGVPDQAP